MTNSNMERNTNVRYPGGRGALWGMSAYLVGFVSNYALMSFYLSNLQSKVAFSTETSTFVLSELVQEVQVPVWKWASLAFYNSHFIDVIVSGLPGGLRESRQQVNLLTDSGGIFLLLLFITPSILIISGILATRRASKPVELRFDVFGTGKGRFFVNGGLTIFFGYFPLAVLGGIVTSASLDGRVVLHTDLLKSFVVAGMIYPLVFGGIGGYLRSYIN